MLYCSDAITVSQAGTVTETMLCKGLNHYVQVSERMIVKEGNSKTGLDFPS